jgi:DNA-binding transcriptional LysR family regulator
MDLRRLEIFYRVLNEGGFTRAARSMSLTQPTLSEAVRLLEEELGTQLLNRLGREVVPTEAGKLLQGYAKKIFGLRKEAEGELKSLLAGEQGALILGGSTIPGTYLLPPLVAEFRRLYPQISLSLQLASTSQIVEGVRQQRLELALVGAAVRDRVLESSVCFGDELVLIVPADHPWAGRVAVAEEDLLQVPLLLREQGSATRQLFEARLALHGHGLKPENLIAEVGGNEALKQGVLVGLGVGVISRLAVSGEVQRGELIALSLSTGPLLRSFFLVQYKGKKLSLSAERFKALLLAAALR